MSMSGTWQLIGKSSWQSETSQDCTSPQERVIPGDSRALFDLLKDNSFPLFLYLISRDKMSHASTSKINRLHIEWKRWIVTNCIQLKSYFLLVSLVFVHGHCRYIYNHKSDWQIHVWKMKILIYYNILFCQCTGGNRGGGLIMVLGGRRLWSGLQEGHNWLKPDNLFQHIVGQKMERGAVSDEDVDERNRGRTVNEEANNAKT